MTATLGDLDSKIADLESENEVLKEERLVLRERVKVQTGSQNKHQCIDQLLRESVMVWTGSLLREINHLNVRWYNQKYGSPGKEISILSGNCTVYMIILYTYVIVDSHQFDIVSTFTTMSTYEYLD